MRFFKSKKKSNKLGVTYSLWSGEELLEGSIHSIRENVDYINVVWQKYSWYGNEASANITEFLTSLKNKGLIDSIIEYEFSDFGNNTLLSKYVLEKKMLGIRDLKEQNCTHCLIMDTDEYYKKEEFKKAKELIYNRGVTYSCCPIYDYKFKPIIQNSRYS